MSWHILPSVLAGSVIIGTTAAIILPSDNPATVCFRPGPVSCGSVAIGAIDGARTTIDFAAYEFTDRRGADALNRAAARGVAVRSVVDRKADLAMTLPGTVWTDCAVAIQHNKILVIDHNTVLTGSYNWTWAADHRNAENLLVLHDAAIADDYRRYFERLIAASQPGLSCPRSSL